MLYLFGCSQFQISALSTLVVGKRPTNIQRLCGWQCVCACFVLCHACFTMFTMQNGKGNATSVAWERMQTWNNNVIGCRHMPNSAHTHIHTHTWERQRQVVLRGVGAFLVGAFMPCHALHCTLGHAGGMGESIYTYLGYQRVGAC
jgi:hypothetical protein